MANFKDCLDLTAQNEGGISNQAFDSGGFTAFGVASHSWPNWDGWATVKQALSDNGNNIAKTNMALKANAEFMQMVSDFYKTNFWDVNKLDLINDQQLCESVYDFGVNSGTSHSAKTLQQAAGVTVDGIIGNGTIAAVNAADGETIYNKYNELRKSFYEHLATDPTQAKFLNSWLSRLKPYNA